MVILLILPVSCCCLLFYKLATCQYYFVSKDDKLCVFGCKIRWHTTKIHANNRKNSRMRLLYIRNLVKEWLKATFRLFRHTLSHKNGVKKDTEGILNIDINNFSSTFHTDDKKKIILMLHLVSRRQRVYLLEGRSRHFNS